jgi:hypothetical protein
MPVAPWAGPSLEPQSGWKAVHVGFDHDGFVLDGLDLWSLDWRKEDKPAVMLPHPAHPHQLHAYSIYSVDDGRSATRFAAAELSNTVWGFYRWQLPVDAAEGESADGRLRYTHSLGELVGGRYDAVAPFAALYDLASGETLFDGTSWPSSRIVAQADGSLLLSLEHKRRQSLFRIDPATGSFRDLATSGGSRPLGELAAAAAAAHAESLDPANAYISRRIAPDGSLLVELEAVEWSNSHWVDTPRVTEIASGRVLLDLTGSDWDAAVSFPAPRTVRLGFRRYHHGGGLEAEIDIRDGSYRIVERSGERSVGALEEIAAALETASQRASAEARAAYQAPAAPAEARGGRRGYRPALLILIGAALAIGAAAFLTQSLAPPPAQKLTPMPKMPRLDPARKG